MTMVERTRRARPPLRISKSGIAGLAVAVLATILPPIVVSAPALAQSQTGWHVEDDPTLFGPEQWWFSGESGKGFGPNNYRYTLAIGGESEADNWAHWYMGNRQGTQELQAYIPQSHATATVNYHIYKDNSFFRKVQIDQSASSGWTSLGRFAFSGADVVVAVFDNDAVENYKQDERSQSQIGVDAIRMRCVSNCATTPTVEDDLSTGSMPQPPQDEQRSVVISLGADAPGEGTCYRTSPCRWLNVTLQNFPGVGTATYRCIRKDRGSDDEQIFVQNSFRFVDDSTRRTFNGICATNVMLGNYVYVTVAGVRSNTIHMSNHISDVSCDESSDDPLAPGKPRDVRYYVSDQPNDNPYVTDDESYGPSQLVVEWKAPTNDSGVQIIGFCVTIIDPNGVDWIAELDVDADSADRWRIYPNLPMFEPGLANAYTIVVEAKNKHGAGPEVRATFGETPESVQPPSDPAPAPERRVEISLGRNNSGGTYCWYPQLPCRWINVTMKNFRAGYYSARCTWSHSESGLERVPISGNIQLGGQASETRSEYCSFNVRPGRSIWVTVDGVRSNTLRFSGDPSQPPSEPSIPTPPRTGTVPSEPRNLRLTLADQTPTGRGSLQISWSPPLEDGGAPIQSYRVEVHNILRNSRGHTAWAEKDQVPPSTLSHAVHVNLAAEFTVRVAAENSVGLSGWTTRTLKGPRAPSDGEKNSGKPGAPENVALQVEGSGANTRLVATWSPPEDDGGAPITRYWIYLYRYKGRSESDRLFVATRSVGTANRRLTIERSPVFGANYEISVRAQNKHGIGAKKDSRTRKVDCEDVRNKWTRKKFGERTIFGIPVPGTGSHHVVAQVNFITIEGDEIRKGDRGGIVSSGYDNLSQTGCSWIFDGAVVVDLAKVEGNALVSEGARIFGDAKVAGNAKVEGNIVLSGDVHVTGNAQLSADVFEEISGGFWNGEEEFIHPLEEQYDAFHEAVSGILKQCSQRRPPYYVRRYDWDGRQRVITRVPLTEPESVARDYILLYLLGDGDTSDGDAGFLKDAEFIVDICIAEDRFERWFKTMIEFLPQPDFTLVFYFVPRVVQPVGLFLAMKSANDILKHITSLHEVDGARRALSAHFIEVLIWCKESFGRGSSARDKCEARLTDLMERGEGDLDYVLDYLLELANENLRKLPEILRDPPHHP